MSPAIGTRIGPYVITSRLGEGGMGVVSRARDMQLERDVAIKTLPDIFAEDPDRLARFRREAQVLASLNHPNIAHVYGLEESGATRCLIMELVEGETLNEKLRRGPLPVDEALQIARQISEALDAAHRKEIIHLDIKPANIKVTPEGRVKVLDFGLARTFARDGPTIDLSDAPTWVTGKVLSDAIAGTPAYMSPEQVRGDKLDERTDVWAFGCVLFELLTGKRVFPTANISEIVASVLKNDPDWIALPRNTPQKVRDLLGRCLEKDQSRRLRDIAQARLDIQAVLLVPEGPAPPELESHKVSSLAVLPFVNASRDSEMDYLSDGLTESIIFNLSKLPQLHVMARSTVFRYKGSSEDAREVGRTLGVQTVVTGTVLQRRDVLVVSAELVDVKNGWQLWGAQYKSGAADIFATEEEIAREISDTLRLKLTPEKQNLLGKRYTESVDAYHLYLRGRFYCGKRTREALTNGIQYFRQAIDKDPTYALAYAGLAEGYVPLAFYGHVSPREALPKAQSAARTALQIDPALAAARAAVGWLKSAFDLDPTEAEKEIRAAIEIDPKDPRAHQGLAEVLAGIGRFPEAFREIKHALELDPLSLSMHAAVAMIHYFGRQYDVAIDYSRGALEMDSSFFPAHWFLGLAYQQEGRFSDAAAELQQASVLSNNSTNMVATLGGVFAAQGNEAEARKILREFDESHRYVSQTFVATIHAGLGDKKQALTCLENSFEERCSWVRFINADARLDSLRDEPRFGTLVGRLDSAKQ